MKHAVKHDLSPELARKATEKAIESYKDRFAKYQPTATWVTPNKCDVRFSAKGFSIKGSLELAPKEIVMELDVPFLLRPFKAQAIELVEDQIRTWTAKAKSGDLG